MNTVTFTAGTPYGRGAAIRHVSPSGREVAVIYFTFRDREKNTAARFDVVIDMPLGFGTHSYFTSLADCIAFVRECERVNGAGTAADRAIAA